MKNNILKELKKRNLIFQISNKKELKILTKKKINIYCGFDPTYESLHIGHLIPLITLKRFQKYGHKINILIGGSTSIIGDPSFRKTERSYKSAKKITLFSKKIKKQIKKILIKNKNLSFFNNKKWFKKMKILYFLKNIGRYFSLNQIINKEAIKKRINKNDKNINFSEISYNLLQSYDYLYLFKKHNIILQIGGSDQWGNITSGIQLIKKKYKKESYGLTLPLMTNKNEEKFGKTINQTLWLNKKKTSPYEFYQFWLNIPDEKIKIFLKQLTFLKISKINKITKSNNNTKNKYILAKEITKIIHGSKEFKNSLFITKTFFKSSKKKISKKHLKILSQKNISKIILKKTTTIKNIIFLLNLVKSKTESHKLIINKSISINNKRITNPYYILSDIDKLHKKYTIIKRGKKKFSLIIWSD